MNQVQKAARNYHERRQTWTASERKATPLTYTAVWDCEEFNEVAQEYGVSKAQLIWQVLRMK